MIKVVIFDLDGTLVNSLNDLADSTNFALKECGFPTHSLESYKYFVGNGIQNLTAKTIPEEFRTDENCKKVYDAFMKYYRVHYKDKTKSYNGIMKLVKDIKALNLKIAVVTNKSQEMALKVVEKLFGNEFEIVFGKQENYPAKPDPTLTLKTMADLGATPTECIFVGDSGVDMQTAINAGCNSIGVLWGFRSEEELKDNGADYIVDDPNEILSIIREINNG